MNILTLTGRRCVLAVSSSPSSIASPPSPESEITCRPGWLTRAPIAKGRALAIEPWTHDPSRRRHPLPGRGGDAARRPGQAWTCEPTPRSRRIDSKITNVVLAV
jgi:hypothetical protein